MNNIKQGFWTDHNQAGLQGTFTTVDDMYANAEPAYKYLVPESTAAVISNAIAVTLTLALPHLYIIYMFDTLSSGQRLLQRFLDKMPGIAAD